MTLNNRASLTLSAALPFVFFLPLAEARAEETSNKSRKWDLTLGVGALSLPEYPGSDDNKTEVLPLINARYNRFFIGGAPGSGLPGGLGAYLYEDKNWTLAAAVALGIDEPRKESDDSRLQGLGDIDATTRAGLSGSYRTNWWMVSASVMSDVEGNKQGTMVNVDARVNYRPFDRLMISAGPGLTWGNDEYMQTFFGVNAEQAANSNFAAYEAGNGISNLRFSIHAQYQLTPHWNIGANITAAQLQSDAADSPIVQDKNQTMYGAFLTYRF
ncbi:hypothetical protein F892_02356 [Acinetobacter vivianii]|uniref:MltA-interacting protein n=1 Tax=Acinetobacter vivianii TaxID=1776742 RepID=N9NQ18_9GAMM|nr:MipA/OmpV family protein [Acinetobacter vivianii]ENX23113.1 hypothetical protein F892_02356 [Acinetobacter vivianii]GGI60572.1 MltA-interacting MipA family protein [Acinetobacter vivianii]